MQLWQLLCTTASLLCMASCFPDKIAYSTAFIDDMGHIGGLNQWCCAAMHQHAVTRGHRSDVPTFTRPPMPNCIPDVGQSTGSHLRDAEHSTWPGGNATCCDELTVPDTGAAGVAYAHGLTGLV